MPASRRSRTTLRPGHAISPSPRRARTRRPPRRASVRRTTPRHAGRPTRAAELAELAVGLTAEGDVAGIAIRRCRAAALRVAVGDPDGARRHLDAGLPVADAPGSGFRSSSWASSSPIWSVDGLRRATPPRRPSRPPRTTRFSAPGPTPRCLPGGPRTRPRSAAMPRLRWTCWPVARRRPRRPRRTSSPSLRTPGLHPARGPRSTCSSAPWSSTDHGPTSSSGRSRSSPATCEPPTGSTKRGPGGRSRSPASSGPATSRAGSAR